MANTTFSGPVISTNGFVGNITGDVTGNVTGNVTGRVVGTVFPLGVGGGAIPITSGTVQISTGAGAAAFTLANGTVGQFLTLVMVIDGGGDGTLTPTTKTGFSTIVFDAAGDAVTLQYFTALGWMVVANSGATINA
jgi:hypothetical protein